MIVGTGIMLFGAWVAVKSFGVLILRKEASVQDFMSSYEDAASMTPEKAFISLLVMTAIYAAIELAVRVFVGRSAIKEGRGEKAGKAYIVFTYLLIFSTLISVLLEIAAIAAITAADLGLLDMDIGSATQSSGITALVIDMTSLVMMIQMLVSAGRVRKFKKQQNIKEAAHAA